MSADEGSEQQMVELYGAYSEPELLKIAAGYDQLTEAAQAVLRAEFHRRGMEAPLVEDFGELAGKLVTVWRYRDLSEAIVARSLLESAGIRAELRDENYVRLDWQMSNFIGGLRLQVEAADVTAATGLLEQAVPGTIEFGDGEEYVQPRCPVCGSQEITFEGASRAAALSGLYFAALPLPAGRESWRCEVCGARFDEAVAGDSLGG